MFCENLAMFDFVRKKVSFGKHSGTSYCCTLIETHIMEIGHQIMDRFRLVFPIMGSVEDLFPMQIRVTAPTDKTKLCTNQYKICINSPPEDIVNFLAFSTRDLTNCSVVLFCGGSQCWRLFVLKRFFSFIVTLLIFVNIIIT